MQAARRRQRPGRRETSWRRRQVDIFGGYHVNRVLDAGANVLRLKVRVIVAQDVRKAQPFAHQLQNILYRNASARDAGLAEMSQRIDGDAGFHGSSPPTAAQWPAIASWAPKKARAKA